MIYAHILHINIRYTGEKDRVYKIQVFLSMNNRLSTELETPARTS